MFSILFKNKITMFYVTKIFTKKIEIRLKYIFQADKKDLWGDFDC